MLQTTAIDVAIGLILMYLMLSLLCTVINEFIATKLSLRAKSLAATLKELLDNEQLRSAFHSHGLIVGTKRATATGTQSTVGAVANVMSAATDGVRKVRTMAAALVPAVAPAAQPAAPASKEEDPSYLSSRTVALALIGCLNNGQDVPAIADVRAAVTALPAGSKIRDALLASLTEAQGDIDKLRTSIATWFDDSMERLSGAYKRQLKWISMLIGLTVAIAFNADSFKVATTLWSDPALRASVTELARAEVKRAVSATSDTPVNESELQKAIEDTKSKLSGLPIGWSCDPSRDDRQGSQAAPQAPKKNPPQNLKEVFQVFQECVTNNTNWMKAEPTHTLVQILGWLLTAAALSLGAPFWFDLLGKFVNLRGAGNKPQRADALGTLREQP